MNTPGISLDQIRIASLCNAAWDDMQGDERVRLCLHCDKRVYDLSGLTRDELQALIATNEGEPCARFYRRADGTMLTTDCPVGAWDRVSRLISLFIIGALMAVTLLGIAVFISPNDGNRGHRVGNPFMELWFWIRVKLGR